MSQDRRKQARVSLPIQVQVVSPGEPSLLLSVQDISLSGVLVLTSTVFAPVGERVALRLALTQGVRPVTLQAETVRVVMAPSEGGGELLGLGMQFVDVTGEQRRQLEDLIQRGLLGVGTHERIFPRVSCLLDARWMSATQRRVVLRDISEGGLGLHSDTPAPPDAMMTVEVLGDESAALRLSGQVVSCQPDPAQPGHYNIGVRLVGMAPSVRRELQLFLERLWRRQQAAPQARSGGGA